jgi:hypothetical protein
MRSITHVITRVANLFQLRAVQIRLPIVDSTFLDTQ